MPFYWAIFNWNLIWNIDLYNYVYCDLRLSEHGIIYFYINGNDLTPCSGRHFYCGNIRLFVNNIFCIQTENINIFLTAGKQNRWLFELTRNFFVLFVLSALIFELSNINWKCTCSLNILMRESCIWIFSQFYKNLLWNIVLNIGVYCDLRLSVHFIISFTTKTPYKGCKKKDHEYEKDRKRKTQLKRMWQETMCAQYTPLNTSNTFHINQQQQAWGIDEYAGVYSP